MFVSSFAFAKENSVRHGLLEGEIYPIFPWNFRIEFVHQAAGDYGLSIYVCPSYVCFWFERLACRVEIAVNHMNTPILIG